MSMIQISKRQKGTSKLVDVLIRIGAIVLSLIFIGIVLAIMGYDPFKVFGKIIQTPFKRFKDVMNKTIMLTTLSLGIAIAFRMKFWNIGAEGQFYMGAFGAASMAFMCPDLPPILLLPLMCVAGFICGGLWALIPAVIKARFGASETLVTLMMNYIATQLVAFFTIVWEVPKGSGKIGIINQNTNSGWLPQIFGSKYLLSILVAVVITIFMYIYLQYSKHGYEITVVGESENTAKYVGIKVEKVIIRTMVLSGAICGLVGLLLVGGINHTVTTTIAGGQGFTAVLVSWMSKFNPLVMVFSSFLIIFMDRGASEISTNFGLNHSYADILTGIILFFIIGCEFFITYRLQFRKKAEKEEQ